MKPKYHFLQHEFFVSVLYTSIVPQISPFLTFMALYLLLLLLPIFPSKLKFLRAVTKCVFSVGYSYTQEN